jgi:hypothetical protein
LGGRLGTGSSQDRTAQDRTAQDKILKIKKGSLSVSRMLADG